MFKRSPQGCKGKAKARRHVFITNTAKVTAMSNLQDL